MVPPSQITPMPGEQVDAVLLAQMRTFYRMYDPSKTDDEVVKLALWTGRHGVNELNTRLRQKYSVDLYSAGPGYSQQKQQQQAPVDFLDRLVPFYRKHDPLKSYNEIVDVNAWAIKHGIDALNQQLTNKYGRGL